MGLFKRASRVVVRALKRLSGLLAIDSALDLGNGLTVDSYRSAIETFAGNLDLHNQEVATFNKSKNRIDDEEKALSFLNRRILAAVGSKFGFDSDEYEMAGGTRRSEIRRSGSNDSDETSG